MNRQIARTVAIAALVGTTISACSSAPRGTISGAELVLATQASGLVDSYSTAPTTIAETLPSTHYVSAVTGEVLTISNLVVTGRSTSWEPGVATVWPAGDGDAGKQVEWDDAAAETRTVIMNYDVDSVEAVGNDAASADVKPDQQLEVWLPLDGNVKPDAVATGLIDGGKTILFLQHPSNPSVAHMWTISLSGALLGTVDEDGAVTMGVLNAADESPVFTNLSKDAEGLSVANVKASSQQVRTITYGG